MVSHDGLHRMTAENPFEVVTDGQQAFVRHTAKFPGIPNSDYEQQIAFDGTVKYVVFVKEHLKSQGVASGNIMPAERSPFMGLPWAQVCELAIVGESIRAIDLALGREGENTLTREPDGSLRVDSVRRRGGMTHRSSVTFDPSLSYMLRRSHFVLESDAGGALNEVALTVVRAGKTPNGIDVPGEVLMSGSPLRQNLSEEEIQSHSGSRFVFHSVEPIMADEWRRLALKMPVGAAVYDGIHNLSFIAGKAVVVADTDGTHYHTSLDAFPFLHDYTDPHTGMTDEQWNASPQKRMVEETWTDVVDGKIVPRSAGARPVSAAAPAPLATERGTDRRLCSSAP